MNGSQNNPPSIAVMGIGNILFSDEGLGIYATEYLKANFCFSPEIDLIDGGTLGMNLIHYYQSYGQMILLDTISVQESAPAGSVYCLTSEDLQGMGRYRKTAHEIEVLQTLELGALAGDMAEITIIAMVPEDMEAVNMALTDSVQCAMPLLVETVRQKLTQYGIASTPLDNLISFDAIIERYRHTLQSCCA